MLDIASRIQCRTNLGDIVARLRSVAHTIQLKGLVFLILWFSIAYSIFQYLWSAVAELKENGKGFFKENGNILWILKKLSVNILYTYSAVIYIYFLNLKQMKFNSPKCFTRCFDLDNNYFLKFFVLFSGWTRQGTDRQ